MTIRLPPRLLKDNARLGAIIADIPPEDAILIILHQIDTAGLHEQEAWRRFLDRNRKRTGKSADPDRNIGPEIEQTETRKPPDPDRKVSGNGQESETVATALFSLSDSYPDLDLFEKTQEISEPSPSSLPLRSSSGDGSTARGRARGGRLPKEWTPDEALVEWTHKQGRSVEEFLDRFRDHWAAQPGAKGVKLDWDATWRNWVRAQPAFERPSGVRPVVQAVPKEGRHWDLNEATK